jgi:hypothetical protein
MPKKKATKAVAKKEEFAVSTEVASFEEDAGAGFENADADSFTIPYLIVLQSNSPQIDEDDPKYITGAKAGMFMNTVTEELFDEVTCVPVHYEHKMVEWVPRDAGGGFRGQYDIDDPKVLDLERGDDGKFILDNGNFMADTRYHFILVMKEDGAFEPVVLSLTSTQIKKSKNWMTQMNNLKIKGSKGMFTPATFSHKYTITSVGESNDKGNWKGWKFSMDSILAPEEMYMYAAAKEFRDAISKGAARAAQPMETEAGTGKEDVPF